MDTGRVPHFDGTNYPYWSVRMASYLEAVGLDVWRVTREGTNPPAKPDRLTKADEKEIHFNAIARNALLESLSMEVFNRVYSLSSAQEIWQALKDLHDGTSDIKEEKYSLVKSKFDSFKMLPNELANDMYSRLNVIVNELNSLGMTKITDAEVSRKIISVLPKDKYASIVTYLFNHGDMSTMTPVKCLGKIMSYEIYHGIGQDTSSSMSLALTSHEGRMKKGKGKKVESSSSSSEEEEEDDEEDDQDQSSSSDDEETKQLIKTVEKALKKLNSKGVPITIEDLAYNSQSTKQKRRCFGCGEKGHFQKSCPYQAKEDEKNRKKKKEKKGKIKALTSIGHWVDDSDDEDQSKRRSHKSKSRKSSK
jgi:hypothetical protein